MRWFNDHLILFNLQFSNYQFINPLMPHVKADARFFGRDDCALLCYFDRRLDDVFVPIAFARRNVAGQSETLQG